MKTCDDEFCRRFPISNKREIVVKDSATGKDILLRVSDAFYKKLLIGPMAPGAEWTLKR